MHEVIPDTICQCTGLKDKNGKLIWEKYGYNKGQIWVGNG
nr:MAG TPA: YopX protein [Caudoviricetes sp.]